MRMTNDSEMHDIYACDGPLCYPSLSSGMINYDKDAKPTDCHPQRFIEVAKDQNLHGPFMKARTDIKEFGWALLLHNDEIIHVCPECQEELIRKMALVAKKSIETYMAKEMFVNFNGSDMAIKVSKSILSAIICYSNKY